MHPSTTSIYRQIIALNAAIETVITTTLPTSAKPRFIELFVEDNVVAGQWNCITSTITIDMIVVAGFWNITIYSVDALANVELNIMY